MSFADLLTLLFAAAVLADLALDFWLAGRQARHVHRHRDQVPPPFAGRISLAAHQKAADYTLAKLRLGMAETAAAAAVLLGWTLLGGLDLLNRALLQWLGPGMTQQLALVLAFALIGGVLDLPFAWRRTFGLEQRFGFNRSTPRLWCMDLLRSALVAAAIGLPVAWAVLALMAAAGPLWWLWAWGLWMGLNLLLLVIWPTWIAPLFNRFEPLTDAALAERVRALMQRCGFEARGLYVMDGSRRSAHANAYFTGFGAAKRVVFYDTLLARLTPGEVDAVLAHELGHFRHRHILKRMAWMAVASLAGLALLGWLSRQTGFYTGLGVTPNLGGPNDALALLLFLLVVPVFAGFLAPFGAGLSRRHEFEADAYAVTMTGRSDLASALLKLYEDNAATLTPDPLYVRFRYSHPPAIERLARLSMP